MLRQVSAALLDKRYAHRVVPIRPRYRQRQNNLSTPLAIPVDRLIAVRALSARVYLYLCSTHWTVQGTTP